ncbi:MAG: DNA repair protein RecN [Bacteroidota bacterium]|nr:DNA repair protein RecN [Bacteroidota bacterium]
MLQKLLIHNYAIIDHLTLLPDAHLNTITGETGAGKSIVLGALSLILGERADTSVLINKEEKCVVEGYFDVAKNEAFKLQLQAHDLEIEPICIIRREIAVSGKSRAFINDTPVTLQVLNELTPFLVDLQQQFGHLALEQDTFQIDIIDALAQHATLLQSYQKLFSVYKKTQQQLQQLQTQQANWDKEFAYNSFLLNELVEANFKSMEIEELANQLKELSNVERIQQALQYAQHALLESDQALNLELKKVLQQLQGIHAVYPKVAPITERVESAYIELKDIATELSSLQDSISLNPAALEQLQERVDLGYKLLKKHQVTTTDELLAIQKQLQASVGASEHIHVQIETLQKELAALTSEVSNVASLIHEGRVGVIATFEQATNTLLSAVGMPNARFKVRIDSNDQYNTYGNDAVQFLLDANKSGQFLPLHKAASGGEMSRIMLCLKSQTAAALALPTLIFDEVDTGISGEAAKQVGALLKQLALHHQLICITHQPQVAAKGDAHFYVYKEENNAGAVRTQMKVLNQDERIVAIAKMIGGENPSDTAVLTAKELLSL